MKKWNELTTEEQKQAKVLIAICAGLAVLAIVIIWRRFV
jgi:hypothetical protein